MKKIFILSNLIALLLFPSIGSAHGNKFSMVSESIASAIAVFRDNEPGKIRRSFKGVKSWVTETDLIVKIILLDEQVIPYNCKVDGWKHENGEDIAITSCVKLEEVEKPKEEEEPKEPGEDDGHDHNH